MNLHSYRPTKPAPLNPDEQRRADLYATVKRLDEEAAAHRRCGRHAQAEACADLADEAQREIQGLYLL